MATKPELKKVEAYSKIKSNDYNENFDILLDYIEDVSEELILKVNTINSQLSSSVLTQLQSIYPVGSIYIGVTDTCPIASLFGTWELVAEGRVLQGADSSHEADTTIEAGLPNIYGRIGAIGASGAVYEGAFYYDSKGGKLSNDGVADNNVGFDASRCSDVYGNSDTVQPPAYVVNIWKRTA
ncbi:MAG: phage baseplate protein [Candidatus Gastranaerophilaceae bacterium]